MHIRLIYNIFHCSSKIPSMILLGGRLTDCPSKFTCPRHFLTVGQILMKLHRNGHSMPKENQAVWLVDVIYNIVTLKPMNITQ